MSEDIRHLKVDEPDDSNRLDHMWQGVLGKPLNRLEGPQKVCGLATYADEAHPEGALYGVLVRATITKGKVTGIDKDAALGLPGVVAVIDDERLIHYAAHGQDEEAPASGPDKVVFFGQAIALVVAERFEQAVHASQNLPVSYDAQAFEVDPESAELTHPRARQSRQGNPEQAMQEAAFTVDEVWNTPSMSASAMEPHAAVATWDGKLLTVRAGLQMLASNRVQLADALKLKPEQVRLLAPYVGGGFGSKLGIGPEAVAAAIAAQTLGRPVSVTMSRQQEFELTHRRPESRQRIQLGADFNGRLTVISHEVRVSSLPVANYIEPVTQATPFTYAAPNRAITVGVAKVHRSPPGSVRAPGEAIGVTAFECAMDELAEKIGLCPVELRLRNIPSVEPGTGRPYSRNMLAECLRQGAELYGWAERHKAPGTQADGEWLIGHGMASAVRVNMLIESKARVTLTGERAVIETDMTDIGTGSYTILQQICAEMLGLARDQVEVRLGDSALPPSAGSGGSFGAASSGTSVYLACQELRERLAKKLGCAEADLRLQDGVATGPNLRKPLADLLGDKPLAVIGHVEPGKAEKKARQATWGAHFAEVAVNRFTGEVRVRRQLGVFALGRILNPKTARSQCIGGMTFGIGIALTEAIEHDPRTGHIVNHSLADYHLPCHADVPAQEVHFLHERDPWIGPMQAKGAGETAICGAGSAILNAIYNASRVRIRDLPATPDKLLAAGLSPGVKA